MLFSVVCLQLPLSEYLFSTHSAVEPHAVLFHHVVLVRDPAEDLNVADITVPQFLVEALNLSGGKGICMTCRTAQVALLVKTCQSTGASC